MTEPVAQLVHVGCKLLIDEGLVGEIHDKCLVLRIRSLNQVQGTFVHRRTLARHGPRVIHHQCNRNRQIRVLEADERLLDAIFQNLKIVFLQVRNQLVALEHGAVEHDFFHIRMQNVAFPLFVHGRWERRGRFAVRGAHWVAVHGQRGGRGLRLGGLGGWLLRRQRERRSGKKDRENRVIAKVHSSRCVHGRSAGAIPVGD